MQFELTKEYISELKDCLHGDLKADLLHEVNKLHPADIADISDELTAEEVALLYQCLDDEIATDVLIELEEDVRERLLRNLTPKEIAENFIDNMDSDDAADIMAELSDEKKDEVISAITDSDLASDIVDLLLYPEDSAGGLMAKELIKVRIDWTLIKCLREMRKQATDIENVYTIYVVDNQEKLIGTLSLKKTTVSPGWINC